ncbi:ABC transporter ATP-binding protein [Maribacter sp. 2307ULW6-5]|uniref:ABC transporter ATP-binding protein n=1 Tax=Maribacter sp. 2307ULW6-5 TaxID=3386275 RepID=UPI0039BD635F
MLQIENVTFAYGNTTVLHSISVTAQRGEHLAVVGASGCGKSTLLKLTYGLMDLEQGHIAWKDKPILGPAHNLVPGPKYMKYLAQDFDLMPFLSVRDNIGQFLSVFYPGQLVQRTEELLQLIEMTAFADRKVNTLSGGQQQRVALARVLAQRPEVLLLDEPFGHIDNFLKNGLRRNIFGYLKDNVITCIVATHDPLDVLPFADNTLVLKEGRMLAQGAPMALYKRPGSPYVASLFGEASEVSLDHFIPNANREDTLMVYAHEFRVSASTGIPVNLLKSYPMGSHYLCSGRAKNGKILFFNSAEPLENGKRVFLNVPNSIIEGRL